MHAREFAFIAPASIAAGTTTFRLVNDGKEVHQISIFQLAKGKTLVDFAAAMKANKPAPWAVGVGGPNAAGPGQTIDATVTLDAGNYILVCWVPSPGAPVPHMAKGMIQPLSVTAPGGDHAVGGVDGLVGRRARQAADRHPEAGATMPSEKFSARLSIAARETPASSSPSGSRPTIIDTALRPASSPPVSSAHATAATWACRLRCAIRLLATIALPIDADRGGARNRTDQHAGADRHREQHDKGRDPREAALCRGRRPGSSFCPAAR